MKQTAKQTQARQSPVTAPAAKEVRAEKFVLVDDQGRQRAVLRTIPTGNRSDTALGFFDESGRLRLSLREGWQESAVTIFNQVNGGTEEAVRIGYRPDTKGESSSSVTVFDSLGIERAYLKVDLEGNGQLTVLGRDGTQSAVSSDGLTVWGEGDEVVTEIGIPSHPDKPHQSANAFTASAGVPEIKDPYREMGAAIDELRFLIEDGRPVHMVMTELLLLLHRIAEQPGITTKDCLEAAVSRCYHWTLEAQSAQQTHLARLLEARAA